ncbi:MAG: glycine cleavage T C-terminal barrel domain-containing protein, partial [Xanthomonadales bacterium]|nr:glycine cleavage T C-terminal barrel domain-containing protein [Xanthomonadales bacterium]
GRYEQVNAHCDLLVCGGGPHGLLAALLAGRSGLRVILADQGSRLGGLLPGERLELNGATGADWANAVSAELESLPNVLLLPRTAATGVYDGNITTLLQSGEATDWRECLWTVRPRHVLLATGAIEQGLIFPHNDRPGVMLAGAVRQYLNRYAVKLAESAVVATNNDSAYQTAIDLAERGIRVQSVVDSRPEVDEKLRSRLEDLGVELLAGARIAGTRGARGLREARIESFEGRSLGRRACDLLAVSGGWAPRVHLLAHARGTLRFDHSTQAFVPDRLPSGLSVVGSANGIGPLAGQLAGTAEAAGKLCADLGATPAAVEVPKLTKPIVEAESVGRVTLEATRPKQWIDLAHDVTFGDAELAVREGFVSVEHFKRYTTTGMSVDQGKTGNLNAFIVLGALTGREPGEVGVTTYRPPYVPVTLGAIAAQHTGEFYSPRRYLPAHTVHQRLAAHFGDYGWQRPDCYPRGGESVAEAIRREVLAVRNGVGVYDNSPIGKLEVCGPDAAAFLDRFYINDVLSLRPGRARYGLMLNENGVIIDDGVFVRWAEDGFLVHTTSAGVQRIGALMEEWLQCEWRDLRVLVDDVTTQWACFTVAGPQARETLLALGTDIDLSAAALPHMAAAQGTVAGLPARIVRVSFSGETSFEISVPARRGAAFLDAVLEAGRAFDITPYGIEALMVLRLEKGYLHVGSDTDGSSTPDDVGWGEVARRKDRDYLGRRSLFRDGNLDPDRKQLVGLELLDPARAMRPGAHLLIGENRTPPAPTDGWITSAAFSPTLGRNVALGLVSGGRRRLGETLTACDEAQRYAVKVVSPVFYDPENQQLRI